ncbi:MAG: ion transporter, partial [Gammaproteobacteria bacterium]|nr:ion transporter [Gammaproteobacteria bacterium]
DLMYTAMEMSSYSWIFFVSFVVMGTFVIINLFIAVVLNNLDEAKQEQLRELQGPVGKDEMLEELKTTQQALQRLQEKMERMVG